MLCKVLHSWYLVSSITYQTVIVKPVDYSAFTTLLSVGSY